MDHPLSQFSQDPANPANSLFRFKPPRRSPLSEDEYSVKRRKLSNQRISETSQQIPESTQPQPGEAAANSASTQTTESSRSSESSTESAVESSRIPPELLYRLKNFRLFKDAPSAFFSALGRSLRLVQYRPQEYIVKSGEPAKSMYWILRGTVGVTSDDGEAVYAELATGAFFGEIGILFNRPRTATVVARTRVLLGILTKDTLAGVLEDFPGVERLIRDEAQERLVMQEKRKRGAAQAHLAVTPATNILSRPELPPELSATTAYNDTPYNTSLLAIAVDPAPGPSVPPILTNVPRASPRLSQNTLPYYYRLPSIAAETQSIFRPSTSVNVDNIDDTISTRDFLSKLSVFRRLPSAILHELALRVGVVHLKPMDYVVRKGERGCDIFFVVFGEVEVVNPDAPASSRVLARLGPTQYFGEMAYASTLTGHTEGDVRSADVRAVGDGEVLVLRSDTLDDICSRYPSVAEEMKKTASERRKMSNGEATSVEDVQIPNGSTTLDTLGELTKLEAERRQSLRDFTQQEAERRQSLREIVESAEESPPKSRLSAAEMPPPPLPKKEVTFEQAVPVAAPAPTNSPFSGFSKFSFSKKPLKRTPSDSVSPIAASPGAPPFLMNPPPMNPPVGSIYRFNSPLRQSFVYTSHSHRQRLNSVNGFTRRRSSLLASGPLPDSIFVRIFGVLDLPNLMRLSRVCRHWKQLIYLSPSLLKLLDLRPWSRDLDDSALVAITKFAGPRPQVINVSGCYHITDSGFSYMINEIGIRGCIRKIYMRDNWSISAMAIMDLSVVGQDLQAIDLSNCRKVRDDVVERLIGFHGDYKYGCHKLTELDLSYCKYLTDKTMLHLATNAADRLASLNLTRCTTITDNGYCFWAETQFPHMKSLVLRDCTFITDNAISSVATACPYLEHLDLTFCCVLTDNAVAILSLLCKYIRWLNLSFCGSAVSDSSLASIASMPQLEELFITGCVRVTREGVDNVIANSSTIQWLDLSQCPRANTYRGESVPPFEKIQGKRYACLRVAPHDRIVKVVI